jgi:hypothetical protein
MNPAYDHLEPTPKPKSSRGCIVFVVGVLLVCLVPGLIGHFRNSNETIEIRVAVTIFEPRRVGIDPVTCSAFSFDVELTSYNKHVQSLKLGQGEPQHGSDGDACRFTFTTKVAKSESYELSAPGTDLPTKRLDRISDRMFDDGGTEFVMWEIWWDP